MIQEIPTQSRPACEEATTPILMGRMVNYTWARLTAPLETIICVAQGPKHSLMPMPEELTNKGMTSRMSLPQVLARITPPVAAINVADHQDITSTPRHRQCLKVLQLCKVDGSTSQSGRSSAKMRVG